MALTAIEKVRDAELTARNNIVLFENKAQEKINSSKERAELITERATEKALADCLSKEERARKKADEIMVTARNQSLLSCEELKRISVNKQDSVNKRILKLISEI